MPVKLKRGDQKTLSLAFGRSSTAVGWLGGVWLVLLSVGCGNGAPAGLADLAPTDPNRLPLVPGLYVGRLDCIQSIRTPDGYVSSTNEFRQASLGISDTGLPKYDGVEVRVGMYAPSQVLGASANVSVTSVELYSNGVTVEWAGELYYPENRCTLSVSESFNRSGDAAIRHSYTLTQQCPSIPGPSGGYSEVCDGVLDR